MLTRFPAGQKLPSPGRLGAAREQGSPREATPWERETPGKEEAFQRRKGHPSEWAPPGRNTPGKERGIPEKEWTRRGKGHPLLNRPYRKASRGTGGAGAVARPAGRQDPRPR